MSTNPLNEYQESVLREIAQADRGSDQTGLFRAKSDIEKEFNQPERLEAALKELFRRQYIKDIKTILAAIGDKSIDYDAYQVTALGRNYLANSAGMATNYNVAGSANIAHNSPGASQTINMNELDSDLKQKILELETAVKEKSPDKIKKALGYIADKSLDVAIAIVTKGIGQ